MFRKNENKKSKGDALFYTATQHYSAKRWAETVEFAQKALKKGVKNYDEGMVYAVIGYALTQLNRRDEAIEAHKKSVELSPELVVTWRYYGITLRVDGDFDGAEDCYERALAIEPDDELTLTSLGALYIFRSKPQKAIDVMKRVKEDEIQSGLTFGNYALALGQVGRFADAEEALSKAVALGYANWREVRRRTNEMRDYFEGLELHDTSWLPERCSQCGAALSDDTVHWVSKTSVQCGYCGSVNRKNDEV